jgi:hypothetical protein
VVSGDLDGSTFGCGRRTFRVPFTAESGSRLVCANVRTR